MPFVGVESEAQEARTCVDAHHGRELCNHEFRRPEHCRFDMPGQFFGPSARSAVSSALGRGGSSPQVAHQLFHSLCRRAYATDGARTTAVEGEHRPDVEQGRRQVHDPRQRVVFPR